LFDLLVDKSGEVTSRAEVIVIALKHPIILEVVLGSVMEMNRTA
jgi:hypothetical protein